MYYFPQIATIFEEVVRNLANVFEKCCYGSNVLQKIIIYRLVVALCCICIRALCTLSPLYPLYGYGVYSLSASDLCLCLPSTNDRMKHVCPYKLGRLPCL